VNNLFNKDFSKIKFEPLLPAEKEDTPVPPVFVVEVAELPRGADIEWFSMGISRCTSIHQTSSLDAEAGAHVTSLGVGEGESWRVEYFGVKIVEDIVNVGKGERKWRNEMTVYTTKTLPEEFAKRWRPVVIPCKAIWGGSGEGVRGLEAVVVVRRELFCD